MFTLSETITPEQKENHYVSDSIVLRYLLYSEISLLHASFTSFQGTLIQPWDTMYIYARVSHDWGCFIAL